MHSIPVHMSRDPVRSISRSSSAGKSPAFKTAPSRLPTQLTPAPISQGSAAMPSSPRSSLLGSVLHDLEPKLRALYLQLQSSMVWMSLRHIKLKSPKSKLLSFLHHLEFGQRDIFPGLATEKSGIVIFLNPSSSIQSLTASTL